MLLFAAEMIIYGFTVHARYRGPRGGGLSSVVSIADPANTPPHPHCTHASSQNLQLSTTRQTNIVPRALAKLQGAITPAPHAAVVPLRTEFLRSPVWMRPGDLWSLPRQGEFDLVCVVLWCGDAVDAEAQAQQRGRGWSKRRRLLCAGLSGDMLLVELAENKETLFFAAPPVTPMLMQVENLQYQRFEKKLNLHTASATALTLFKPRGPVQMATGDKIVAPASLASHALFAHPSLASFHSWVCSSTSALVWRTMLDLVNRMMDGRWNGDQTSSFNKEEFGAVRGTHRHTPYAREGGRPMLDCCMTLIRLPLCWPAACVLSCHWPVSTSGHARSHRWNRLAVAHIVARSAERGSGSGIGSRSSHTGCE